MWKSFVTSAILGGLVVFLWNMFSWMILPWHEMVTHSFIDQEAVGGVLLDNAPTNGVYVMPSIKPPPREYQRQMARGNRRMWGGPFVFANVQREGIVPNQRMKHLFLDLIADILGAALITGLLLQTKKMPYWRKVKFVALTGFIVGFISLVPLWNWWAFPMGYTIVGILDLTFAWFAGGLVIAYLARR